MHIYLLFIILLQSIIVAQAQEATPTMTVSSAITFNTTTTNSSSTIMTSSNITTSSNATITLSFSPSPTSFVFTHFPVFPTHIGSMSSSMSSAKPSQSAPYPDDTIGKNGRLHISSASTINSYTLILLMCPFIIIYIL